MLRFLHLVIETAQAFTRSREDLFACDDDEHHAVAVDRGHGCEGSHRMKYSRY